MMTCPWRRMNALNSPWDLWIESGRAARQMPHYHANWVSTSIIFLAWSVTSGYLVSTTTCSLAYLVEKFDTFMRKYYFTTSTGLHTWNTIFNIAAFILLKIVALFGLGHSSKSFLFCIEGCRRSNCCWLLENFVMHWKNNLWGVFTLIECECEYFRSVWTLMR